MFKNKCCLTMSKVEGEFIYFNVVQLNFSDSFSVNVSFSSFLTLRKGQRAVNFVHPLFCLDISRQVPETKNQHFIILFLTFCLILQRRTSQKVANLSAFGGESRLQRNLYHFFSLDPPKADRYKRTKRSRL